MDHAINAVQLIAATKISYSVALLYLAVVVYGAHVLWKHTGR